MEYVNLEAESSVVGSILINGKLIEDCDVKPEDFHNEHYGEIYAAMLAVSSSGKYVDTVSVSNILGERLALIGGYMVLTNLAQSVPSINNFSGYVDIVREKSLMRQIYKRANAMKKTHFEGSSEMIEYLQETLKQMEDQKKQETNLVHIKQGMSEHAESIMSKADGEFKHGLPSKFIDLSRVIGSYRMTELSIVAARPSLGKTAFMLNEAIWMGENGAVVAIFSAEMARRLLIDRMISNVANIDGQAVRDGELDAKGWEKYTMAASHIVDMDIYIDDTSNIRLSQIKAGVQQLRKEHPDRELFVCIDYLQLITLDKQTQNRNLDVSLISSTLKQIARDNNAHVMALSQLSRGVEQRQDKRPMMSDLRDSGSIEQDADVIGFLYRDDYYNSETEKKNIVEIIISKNRNGAIGTVEVVFLKSFNKFVNYERVQSEMFAPQDEQKKGA